MKITVVGGGPGGLFFSILVKKAWPQSQIKVLERNKADDAFGFLNSARFTPESDVDFVVDLEE